MADRRRELLAGSGGGSLSNMIHSTQSMRSLRSLRDEGEVVLSTEPLRAAASASWSGSMAHLGRLGKSDSRATLDLPDDDEPAEGVIIAPTGHVTAPLAITAAVAIFGSSFPHGYNTGVLNAPTQLIKDFLNQTSTERFGSVPDESVLNILWAFSVSIYLIGGCAGAFSAGWFADRFGRKKALLICHAFGFISAVLFGFCKLAKSFEMLILGRLIVGFGCGAGSGLVPMYLTEIAPVNIRGAMGVLHQFALTCGILVSQCMGVRQALGTEALWPILLAFTAFPCLVSLLILPWFPDSPRHLLVNLKKSDEAREALQRFRGTKDVDLDIQEMELEQQQMAQEAKWSFKQLLSTRSLRMPLLLVCGLACCQQLSGINVVFYYSTGVFEDAGIPPEKTQYATIGAGLINVIMTGISVPLMEKSGRRPLLLIGMLVMVGASVVITIALNLQGQVHWMSYVSIVCIICFVIGFAIGLGSIPQFIGAELFKQGPRPPAMSIAGFLNWLSNFIIGITFPSMQMGMQAFSFAPFIAVLLLFWIFLWWKLPETKNKTYDEIYKLFQVDEIDDEERPETVGNRLANPELESAPFLDKTIANGGVTIPTSPSNITETSFTDGSNKANGDTHNNDKENSILLDKDSHVASFHV